MADALIIDACRTPRGIGKQGKGALAHLHPPLTARAPLREHDLSRVAVLDGARVLRRSPARVRGGLLAEENGLEELRVRFEVRRAVADVDHLQHSLIHPLQYQVLGEAF